MTSIFNSSFQNLYYQDSTMLRRPPTSIELKLDDLLEYETLRREQDSNKDSSKSTKPYNEVPKWQPGHKSSKEVYERIGYVRPSFQYQGASPDY